MSFGCRRRRRTANPNSETARGMMDAVFGPCSAFPAARRTEPKTSVVAGLAKIEMPRRIQRKRTRGWVKPDGVRIVDRTTIFGNPYKVREPGVPDRATATRLYERDLLAGRLR